MLCWSRVAAVLLTCWVVALPRTLGADTTVPANEPTPSLAHSTHDEDATGASTTRDWERCTTTTDCNFGLQCDPNTKKCTCKNPEHVVTTEGFCYPGAKLGDKCIATEQCQKYEKNAACVDGVCACTPGHYLFQDVNSTECSHGAEVKSNNGTAGDSRTTLQASYVVLIVMSIMFVGICLALQLYSRARFRNQRTIFNSPHPRLMHIKLGRNKNKRRASHGSLQVPTSRQPSICSSHNSPLPRRASRSPRPSITDGYMETPTAEAHPSHESLAKKDSSRWGKNGPDVLPSTSMMANGPGPTTVIITDNHGATISSTRTPSPPTRV